MDVVLPGLDEVPVGKVLRQVVGVGRAGPVHKVQVDVVGAKVLQGRCDSLGDAVVPGVVELGGDPDLATRDTGVLDTGTDLSLVAVGKSTRTGDVSISYTTCSKLKGGHTCRCGGSPSEEHS